MGQHTNPDYVERVNPSASVPALENEGFHLGQSLAILNYLDAIKPEPRLIPSDPHECARVLELTALISCDIHPVNNLRILRYLEDVLQVSADQKSMWYRHWVGEGMIGVERLLTKYGHGDWCFGDSPTIADIALVPQMANATRMGCDLTPYPRSRAVYERASNHPAFMAAAPAMQPDYAA